MIKKIVTSILVTSVISAGVGFGLAKIFGFWQAFSLSFILQVIIFYFINTKFITKQQIELEKILNERYDILSKNLVQFPCPCGQFVFEELIYINGENAFKCEKCENNINVNIGITPAIATAQLDVESTLKKLRELDEELEYNKVV